MHQSNTIYVKSIYCFTKYFIFYTSGNIPCNLLAGDVEFDVQSNDILFYEQQVSCMLFNVGRLFGIEKFDVIEQKWLYITYFNLCRFRQGFQRVFRFFCPCCESCTSSNASNTTRGGAGGLDDHSQAPQTGNRYINSCQNAKNNIGRLSIPIWIIQ